MTVSRDSIVTAARSYVGVRWRHLGRDRAGLDCIGLLVMVSRDCDIPYKDVSGYKKIPDRETFRDEVAAQSDPGDLNVLKHGSIVLLMQRVYPCHCGIVALDGEERTIIHASLGERGVVEQPLRPFTPTIVRVREFRGVR